MDQTTLTDIRIPFWRLTGIILKFMLASIPAVILLYIIMALISLGLMLLFGGLIAGTGLLEELFQIPDGADLIEQMEGQQDDTAAPES